MVRFCIALFVSAYRGAKSFENPCRSKFHCLLYIGKIGFLSEKKTFKGQQQSLLQKLYLNPISKE